MNAGRLRHLVDLQQAVVAQDSSGDPVVSWTTIATLRAEVSPLRGREGPYDGQQILAETDTRITVRWSPITDALTPTHRLVHQGVPFNVVSAAHVDLRKREVEIFCKSGVNDG